MTEAFDIDQFIEHYIKNIRVMQQLTDTQIRDVMLHKIEDNPDYFEIISDVSQKVDNKKLIKKVLANHQKSQKPDNYNGELFIPTQDLDKFSGRKIA